MRAIAVFLVRLITLLAALLPGRIAGAQPLVLDPLTQPAGWKVITSDAVILNIAAEADAAHPGLRLEYEFKAGTGYAIIQRDIAVEVGNNYEFSFWLRGDGPTNNLEFKLLDASGENVWWHIHRTWDWPREWTRIAEKKRDIEFAWGPLAGAPLKHVAKIEFAISSSGGGKGTVWLSDLRFRLLTPPRTMPAVLRPAASEKDRRAALAVDGDGGTTWCGGALHESTLTLDQGESAEFGGVEMWWAVPPAWVELEGSDDERTWAPLAPRSSPDRDTAVRSTVVPTPGVQYRYLRVRCGPAADPRAGDAPALATVALRAADFSITPNAMISALAKESPRGTYPRAFLSEQSYWTVIGINGDNNEALLNEEGMVEVAKRGFSLEPFIERDGRLLTWADATHTQRMVSSALPMPVVTRSHPGLELDICPVEIGASERPVLEVVYPVHNTSDMPVSLTLHVAVRPFQVNPPWQRLNFEGGVANISSVEATGPGQLRINDAMLVTAIVPKSGPRQAWASSSLPGRFSLTTAERKDASAATRSDGLSSGVLSIPIRLEAHGTNVCVVEVAQADHGSPPSVDSPIMLEQRLQETSHTWDELTSRTTITVPKADQWIADTFRAQQAYILVNRDGPAIQPGSRSYERSWARDGSMTSAALLALGHTQVVKEWIDWYGDHLFPDGKVPCVVDARGPDPVPEYDSQGEYIWAVANYYRYTGDDAFLEKHWPRVVKAIQYIEKLRAPFIGDDYRLGEWPKNAFCGLVPESISHEGYSAKPMHSYWDDFFVLLGLKEAEWLQRQPLIRTLEDGRNAGQRADINILPDIFRDHLYRSISLAMEHAKIDYIPGCVELGDFDSTSTTIALWPCDEGLFLPREALTATFERYWKFASDRMRPDAKWDAFTPYELRHVGTFIRLGQPERAYTLLNWFHQFQRPEGWHHWAEVVYKDPLTPKFIGDMPHTWVGSDFLNSIIDLFAQRDDGRTTLFAGVPQAWIDSGEVIGITNLHAPSEILTATMKRRGNEIHVHVAGEWGQRPGAIFIRRPAGALPSPDEDDDHDLYVNVLPSDFTFRIK